MKGIETKVENSLADRLDEQIVKVKNELDSQIHSIKQNQLVSKSEQDINVKELQKSLNFQIDEIKKDSKMTIEEVKKNIGQEMETLKLDIGKK